MKACCSGCSLLDEPRPSIVVISLLATVLIGVTHERTALPSTSTVQAPHCARPQPNFAPLSSRSLRSTYSNGVSGSAGTERLTPLTLILMAMLGVSRGPPARRPTPVALFFFRPVLFCADAGAASSPCWCGSLHRARPSIPRRAPSFRARPRRNPQTYPRQSRRACQPLGLGNRRG